MRLYAVIPTHNRHDDLAELLASIPASVEVLVIDNASTPPVMPEWHTPPKDGLGVVQQLGPSGVVSVIRDEEQPPNLSRLWNIGLDWAERRYRAGCKLPVEFSQGDDWAVAILNDDVVLPPGFLELMAHELLVHDVDIAFPGGIGEQCYVNTNAPFPGVGLRLTGWCFVVRGSSGLRADESLRWWCGDDDLQAQAVVNGRGTVRVGMFAHQAKGLLHKHPDESTTGVLREQTNVDMSTFIEKWGQRPW